MIDSKDKAEADTEQVAQASTILVYGSDECSHCVNFKKKLDSAGYEYTFYDVEKEQKNADEMLLKLQKSGFRGNIHLPVVEVNGNMHVNPELQIIEQAL
ncbi:glutaredoxin family protein [Porifericola rhodea]|uniref:glutaredoxin family protein n=1 Tax=Porifericola rhodea TaxID=930972 RepID=UPI002666D646|nr:glutaredoxin family protein [Porifericola rhodea]WKN30733.1 glutaredoxin family protein [Porifericola rhodea]